MTIESVVANAGSGGAKFATDQITEGANTLEVPYTKLMSGADGSKELIGGDAANGLDVDVTRLPALPAGSNTIGTVNAAQSGTWTVQPGNTPNTTAWKVDGSAVTQPVSGTVTANAGTNLNTSALALDATLGTTNTEIGGLTETAPASDTASSGLNGRLQRIAQRLTSLIALLPSALIGGRLDVNAGSIAGTAPDTNSGNKSAGTLRVVLATDQPALTNKLLVTPDSVALPANQSVNCAQVGGTNTDTNSGNKSAGTIRVVLATDQPALTNKLLVTPDSVALPANQSVNVSQINGVTTTMGNGVSGTGVQRVTIASDSTGQVALAAGSNNVGLVVPTPGTTGGWSKVKYAAQTTTVQTVKGSGGTLGGWYVWNPNATVAYVQIFDVSGSVTLGTTAPDMTLGIPPNSAANVEWTNGINFANAIKLACTTTATGSTAPGTGLDVNILYK